MAKATKRKTPANGAKGAKKAATKSLEKSAKKSVKKSATKSKAVAKKATVKTTGAVAKAAKKTKTVAKKAAVKSKTVAKKAAVKSKAVAKKAAVKSKAVAKKAVKKAKAVAKKAATKPKAVAKKASKKAEAVALKIGKKAAEATSLEAPMKPPAKARLKATRSEAAGAAPNGKTPSLVGQSAPAFELSDQSGQLVSSASLAGKPYVLYFYPKDDTPGCTQEACDFRDGIGNFVRAGVTIFGVSPDSVKSHAKFAEKFSLPFSLLSDPDKTLAQAYGTWGLKSNYGRDYWGIVRSTFLIGGDGKVNAEWRGVRVKGHSDAVLAAANPTNSSVSAEGES